MIAIINQNYIKKKHAGENLAESLLESKREEGETNNSADDESGNDESECEGVMGSVEEGCEEIVIEVRSESMKSINPKDGSTLL